MAKIIIPTPLRKFTDSLSTFETEGTSIKAAIESLVGAHGELKQHLLDDQGNIRSFIRIYLGEEDIKSLQGSDTAVSSDSVISIVPAIAGGIS
ncbi:UNVERIFIED_CONTAM: hypothetical protein GTU68_033819 [Idotea baltica]|nr:hypothetical protein [Idotea baltica]